MYDVIMKAFGQTVYMVIGSTIFSVILGFIPAIVLTVTAPDGLRPNKIIYGILLGILTGLFRLFGANAEGVSFAIILGNLLVPIIEKHTIPKAFGVKKEGKKHE